MLDINFIRQNQDKVQQNAINKGIEVNISDLIRLDDNRRELQAAIDTVRHERNTIADKTKQAGGRPDAELIEKGKALKTELADLETKFTETYNQYLSLLKRVPNMALESVPVGLSEDENVVDYSVGELPKFDFEPKNHYEIAKNRGWIDKERAANVAGARFAYIKGDLVRLQFAIINFVMDTLSDETVIAKIVRDNNLSISTKPFVPVLPPYMIKTDQYDAMDRLEPRDDRYKIEGEDLWLQGSAEHVLGSMHAGEIFEEADLPVRYLGYATSFRKEAGTYGKDMEGILRMHQFDKLEMETFTTAEKSHEEHRLLVGIQEHMLQTLKLPYQVIKKCTFDIGKPDAAGVDMEVWLPGQNKYRETHTADYMTDYQARRLQTRVRRNNGELELIHTNDATAFALGRLLIAIIENNQTADQKVIIPEALRSYMGEKAEL
ncbi:MAG: serine--tRNA ligase [Candidatus Saccharibacteria bacterium]|nr:serine--tRNA ligase [Candidatus Saccharibacteria bacterium]